MVFVSQNRSTGRKSTSMSREKLLKKPRVPLEAIRNRRSRQMSSKNGKKVYNRKRKSKEENKLLEIEPEE